MNVLVLCPHFRPDVAPTGVVMEAIVDELGALGHRLHVVSAPPWYLQHRVDDPAYRHSVVVHDDTEPWGRVSRVHPFPTEKTNIPARALGFGGFTTLAALVGLTSRSRPDVVLAMSPPITLGAAGWVIARARNIPFVFNVQDVFPDVAVEVGAITGRRVIAAARALERTLYRAADAVTVLSTDLAENVAAKLPRPAEERQSRPRTRLRANWGGNRRSWRPDLPPEGEKVRVIPNFIDTGAIRPQSTTNAYRDQLSLGDRTVVMYAGNLGYSQSVELLIDAAVAMAHDPSVVFVINGGGAARPALERRAAGLDNVVFVDLQPRARLGEVLAAADIHTVCLRRGLARASVPSKLYSVLAAGRPVLASVDPGTEVARVIGEAEAGLAVPPEDPEAFTKALRRLVEDPERAAAMGRSGRRFIESWASPAAIAERYRDLFAELVARRGGARSAH